MRSSILMIAASVSLIPAASPSAAAEATILRDEYGIPHVFAPTLEAAAYAVGYAQAEDRLEELLKNYRRAAGTMAEVFGPEHYRDDLLQRIWQHSEISRARYGEISPKMRSVIESFQNGVKAYMRKHPKDVPSWAQELHPWDVPALSRHIIWGWPMGEAAGDLKRGGIEITPPAYRGSNEMLIAPDRTAMHAPIAVVDPHLSWYGEFRFYEVRIYAGDFNVSGVSIVGAPFPSLGHSRWCSVAMTTGGPDTSDVFEEEVNPAHARQYRFDGEWRDMTVRTEKIGVKMGDKVEWRTVEIESTRHGPILARKNNKAYAVAVPYQNEVGLSDQVYAMMTAHNLTEMKRALGKLQLMAQNVMVGTVEGDIYYVRNGRVPIRAKGVDPSRPVPGNTSANDWRGIHPLEDLVQVTNPKNGWMQNCNVSPYAMMKKSPLVPEDYAAHPYLYNAGPTPAHQRAEMMNDVLDDADHVTVEQAIDIAFDTHVWHAELWQERIKQAWNTAPTRDRPGDAAELYEEIRGWDRKSDADSAGALAFYAFKRALSAPKAQEVDPPADLADSELVDALGKGAAWMKGQFGSLSAHYGDYFRVGREGGEKTWPVGGGTVKDAGMATPRAIGFAPAKEGKVMLGHSGQTSTQVVILTNPPQSFAVIPLGESDHRESGHWDDQAEKLFSKARAAPTYFLDREALEKHVTAKRTLKVPSGD